MKEFQILFDHGEHSELLDPVYSPYGKLGFPKAPEERPWVLVNFVQSLDGVVSLLGPDPSGGDIAQSAEDRWLMDLLRAHADAVVMGFNTLKTETKLGRPRPRGPIFRIMDDSLRGLRAKLHRGPERNVFVTRGSDIDLSKYAVFDAPSGANRVEPYIVTTTQGAKALESQREQFPHVNVIDAGEGENVDLRLALRELRQLFGWKHVLCEGGPTLYGELLRQDLVDEKFVTVAPVDVGQRVPLAQDEHMSLRPTIFGGEGFTKETMARWTWLSCRKVGDHQFHRFRRVRG